MDSSDMRALARANSDKKIEAIYAKELDMIYEAAKAGNFFVDIDEVLVQDEFVDYLIRHGFKVLYYHMYEEIWYECRVASAVNWLSCSKIKVKW